MLVGLLASLTLIVSGAAPASAQNVVGPQPVAIILAVGPTSTVGQTIVGVQGPPGLRLVSATGVAAETADAVRPWVIRAGDLKLPGVPNGVTVQTGKGLEYAIPRGTPEISERVTSVRIMDPVTSGKYQYPSGYAVYMNESGQTVNPFDRPDDLKLRSVRAHRSAVIIEDLLRPDPELRSYGAQPEMDPLTEDDALQGVQLLDMRFDALRSTVGLLCELRTALQLREANTGVLVARGVHELSWSTGGRSPALRFAWVVASSKIGAANRLFELRLAGWLPGAGLGLVAESVAFFAGDVPGLDRIPDYVSDDESTIHAQLAGWHSEFVPVHAVFLDSAPAS